MERGSLLIAETDPAVLQVLPQFLSNRLPSIGIHVAASADEAHHQLSQVQYSASIVAPKLVEGKHSLRLHKVHDHSVLMPVILTATKADVGAVREALLCRGAFDVITKPLQPIDALSSIRGALWHARFLGLLTQRERILAQFKRHLQAYPREVEIRAALERALEYVKSSLMAVKRRMTLLEPESDQLFFDLAITIQARTKDRALDRLNRLIAFGGEEE